jgi:hypothetical protein
MFHRCNTSDEMKKLYRRLSLHLHPDSGGENDLMVLLTEWYDTSKGLLDHPREKPPHRRSAPNSHHSAQFPGDYQYVDDKVFSGDDALDIFEEMYFYSKSHPKWDAEFLENMEDFLEKKGFLTQNQYNALVKTYYAFHMNEQKKSGV